MVDRTEMTERHGAILAELAALGLGLARHLNESAFAAEAPEDKASLTLAFHRASRSVRQTLALEARLQRDAQRQALEDRAEVRQDAERRVAKRRARVRATLERLIWTEHEDAEAEVLVDNLEMLLDEEELSDGFTADPLDAHIARICEALGLKNPPLQGEVSPQATEGVEAHSPPPNRAASPPPQSRRDSSPSGGASGGADHPWRSSS
ncbi:MAG: hypothetical protein JWP86_3288 [Phenylobacterium sp.]|nr:hypothetical protein [Phenylobacterium sp.]